MVVLAITIICNVSASAQYDVYGTFASGNWWQEIGYAGVGNNNEVLAVGEAILPNIVENSSTLSSELPNRATFNQVDSIVVTSVSGMETTVSFQLLGCAADPAYVSGVKVWARKYDATYASSNTSKVANTFAYPFDYRDPVGKSNAILLYTTNDINEDVYSFTTTAELTGAYVLYITADIKSFDTNDLDKLPLLTQSKKEMGAKFTNITTKAESVGYKVYYTYTPRRGSATQANVTRDPAAVNSSVTLAQKGKNGTNGSRVLVPGRKVLYSPNDFYSKYYRIPAIAKAADGSLVAISDARKYHIHDIKNDIDILARRSTDGGETWSNPVTIAKGSGMDETSTSCSSGIGYGDAAVAALPNGDLLVTMIQGYGFSETTSTNLTKNYYCLSHTNGQSWSSLQEIPADLYGNERGCIAPGNICVAKEGALAGKAIACFRSYKTHTNTSTTRNYFLLFDPQTKEWSRINVGSTGYYKIGTDDEAHLIEVSENTFLLSIRTNGSGYRYFARLVYNATAGTFTATQVTGNNMNLGTYCNGDIMNYEAMVNGTKQNYQLHTLASSTTTGQTGYTNAVRSGLRAFYTQYTGGTSISWTASTNLSDPYNENTYRKETAQYASMTTLSDGSIGVLFEEYPQVVRVDDGDGGDFMMQDVYMLLRVGDIVPNADPLDEEQLLPPTIDPSATTYNCADATDRPNPIVVSHENTIEGVNTIYKVYVYDKNGNQVGVITGNFNDGNSKSLDWDELNTVALDDDGNTLEDFVGGAENSGAYIRVTAICQKDGYRDSEIASQIYLFKTPVRKLMIRAKESSGWGDPYLMSQYIGTYEQGEVMSVGAGALVIANAANKYPYTFIGYSLDANSYVPLTAAQKTTLAVQQITPRQINFTVPTEEQMANNEDGVLVLYAWYESNAMGIKTRVYTNYFDSAADNAEAEITGTYVRHYFHNDWYPTEVMAGEDFPAATPGLTFDNIRNKGNNYATSNLVYNLSAKQQGLDANVVIMPDSRAMGYNAIVMVKSVSGDSYVNKAPKRAAATNNAKYYLLQGSKAPFADGSTVKANATQVIDWYTTNEFSQLMPVKVEGIAFEELVAKGVSSADNTDFDVEVYVVKGNTLTSVSALDSESNYEAKVVHRIRYSNDITTAVDDINANREVKSVRYYNAAGMQSVTPFHGVNIVVTEFTDGTRKAVKVIK